MPTLDRIFAVSAPSCARSLELLVANGGTRCSAAVVATTVGLALFAIVLWGSLVGSMLPLVLRRLGFDPATSSAPFVATLVDVTGLVIYFSVGLVTLKGTLL